MPQQEQYPAQELLKQLIQQEISKVLGGNSGGMPGPANTGVAMGTPMGMPPQMPGTPAMMTMGGMTGGSGGGQLADLMAANLQKLRLVLQETEQIATQMEELLNEERRNPAGGNLGNQQGNRQVKRQEQGDGGRQRQGPRSLRGRKA